MKVSEWIRDNPRSATTVHRDASFEEILEIILKEPHVHNVYVLDKEGRVAGHLSSARIFHLLLAEHRPVHTRRQIMERVSGGSAYELMNSHVEYARPDEELDNVIHRQLEHDLEDMPVLDEKKMLLGLINIREVLDKFRKT